MAASRQFKAFGSVRDEVLLVLNGPMAAALIERLSGLPDSTKEERGLLNALQNPVDTRLPRAAEVKPELEPAA